VVVVVAHPQATPATPRKEEEHHLQSLQVALLSEQPDQTLRTQGQHSHSHKTQEELEFRNLLVGSSWQESLQSDQSLLVGSQQTEKQHPEERLERFRSHLEDQQ